MNEHVRLVRTSFGPIGVIASLPDDEPMATAVLFQGAGPPRFGRNSTLANMARVFAERGVTALRMDYPGQGDSTLARSPQGPLPAIREILAWYREWTGRPDPILIGNCFGGRVAISLAAQEPDVGGLAVILPHPWAFEGGRLRTALRGFLAMRLRMRRVDRRLVRELSAASRNTTTWILAGERDAQLPAIRDVVRRVREPDAHVELEVVPGVALDGAATADVQRLTWERLAARILTTSGSPASQ